MVCLLRNPSHSANKISRIKIKTPFLTPLLVHLESPSSGCFSVCDELEARGSIKHDAFGSKVCKNEPEPSNVSV